MRMVMMLILSCMVLGLLSTLMLPGSDEQVPAGDPLEESLRSVAVVPCRPSVTCAGQALAAPVLLGHFSCSLSRASLGWQAALYSTVGPDSATVISRSLAARSALTNVNSLARSVGLLAKNANKGCKSHLTTVPWPRDTISTGLAKPL